MKVKKSNLNSRTAALIVFFCCLGLHQNCGQMKVPEDTTELSTAAVPSGLKLQLPDGSIIPDNRILPQFMYVFVSIDPLVMTSPFDPKEVLWTHASSPETTCLTRIDDLYRFEIRCDGAGFVELIAQVPGIPQVLRLKKTVKIPQAEPPDVPNLVLFRIRSGTGGNTWNSATAPLEVYVGQTLRFVNEDTIPHQLVTSSGAPCASASVPMEYTEYFDCPILVETGPTDSAHDGSIGPSAKVFIKSLDGAARYNQYCAACHNSLGASFKKGRSAEQIKVAIFANPADLGVPAMSGLRSLTDQDLRAIAYSLK